MKSFTLLLSFILPLFTAAQIYTPGAAATVYFTPYKLENCSMSTDFTSTDLPLSVAVTSGHCYNSTYAFQSYFQVTNFNASNIPCALSIYPLAGCLGDGEGAELSNNGQCVLGPLNGTVAAGGLSFELACGP